MDRYSALNDSFRIATDKNLLKDMVTLKALILPIVSFLLPLIDPPDGQTIPFNGTDQHSNKKISLIQIILQLLDFFLPDDCNSVPCPAWHRNNYPRAFYVAFALWRIGWEKLLPYKFQERVNNFNRSALPPSFLCCLISLLSVGTYQLIG